VADAFGAAYTIWENGTVWEDKTELWRVGATIANLTCGLTRNGTLMCAGEIFNTALLLGDVTWRTLAAGNRVSPTSTADQPQSICGITSIGDATCFSTVDLGLSPQAYPQSVQAVCVANEPCFITTHGQLRCVGSNAFGVQSGDELWVEIVCKAQMLCARAYSGKVQCWNNLRANQTYLPPPQQPLGWSSLAMSSAFGRPSRTSPSSRQPWHCVCGLARADAVGSTSTIACWGYCHSSQLVPTNLTSSRWSMLAMADYIMCGVQQP